MNLELGKILSTIKHQNTVMKETNSYIKNTDKQKDSF